MVVLFQREVETYEREIKCIDERRSFTLVLLTQLFNIATARPLH